MRWARSFHTGLQTFKHKGGRLRNFLITPFHVIRYELIRALCLPEL